MAFCNNCGAQVPEGKQFCASCGQPLSQASAPQAQQQYQQQPPYQPPVQQGAEEFDPADIEKNKTMAGLAYLIFFLPLVACPGSRFGKFHANQGLLLLLVSIAGSIILSIIPIIGWILMIFFPILIVVLGIMGLVNGLNGRAKELPVIGKFKLIK